MTDEKRPLELSAARTTDIVQAPIGSGRIGSNYVMSRCDSKNVAYWDEIGRRSYANLGLLIQEIKARGGRFHVVVRCGKHGWLEMLPHELVEQLQELGKAES